MPTSYNTVHSCRDMNSISIPYRNLHHFKLLTSGATELADSQQQPRASLSFNVPAFYGVSHRFQKSRMSKRSAHTTAGIQRTREGSRLPIYPLRQRCLRMIHFQFSAGIRHQHSPFSLPNSSVHYFACAWPRLPQSQTTTTEVSEWFAGIQLQVSVF